MSAEIVNLAAYKEDRMIERFYELMIGDLEEPDRSILETMDDEALAMFFRLRKRVRGRIAGSLVGQHIDKR